MRPAFHHWRWLPLAALIGGCLLPVAARAAERSSFLAAMESISTDELKQHVDYLAADALEGRESGRRGGLAAGKYVRDRFSAMGLREAGTQHTFYQPFGSNFRNVLAVLDGSDPKLKDQVVIIGAHYDHVGYGTRRNSRGPIGRIHNGADDNASGTAALLELAEAFTMLPEPPKRSVLFFAFDAEERGLFGSKHWASHPTLPLDRVVAMINMDMIGRLRNDRVTVFGSRSGYGWRRLISEQNTGPALSIRFDWTLKAKSDQYPFLQKNIPVLLWHTGLHDEYHSPRDDAHLIRNEGIRRVSRLVFALSHELADGERVPRFRKAGNRESEYNHRQLFANVPERKGRLGVAWDSKDSTANGIRVTRVKPGSAAQKSELKLGDRIVRFAGRPVASGDDLRDAVMRAQSPTTMVLKRPGKDEPVEAAVELPGKPVRLGILWRVDPAEPTTIILSYVIPSSPAARAGLRTGDRICQIGGKDFPNEQEFSRLAKSLPEPLELLVERNGRLRTVVVYIDTKPPEREA